ncbi:hypothetical protein J8F10_06635 [Gemmata sp. G18]|uniref:Peptidase A2 domain-containing protein n=1 Tax=Gemmata palustris TaxID=2822762 RepID=A0ABS5BNB1_9BACT|nr:hypothetical protein [Gemmata palustris]MBP3954957.1 hypothetical protein [Gemmata palustris]
MPTVSGPIESGGAVVDVLIGVPSVRAKRLQSSGFPIPQAVHVRVLIDTGAHQSGFSPRVFQALDLRPIDRISILTPSTPPDRPHLCDVHLVALALVASGRANQFPETHVIETDCWHPAEGIEGLIGRDILARCNFWYVGVEGTFTIAF